MLNIGEAIPRYFCMFLSFSCEWRSSVVQARMCKLGRDPLIFLKILVVIGHVCIYWSKVAEGFSVFKAVLLWFFWGVGWGSGLTRFRGEHPAPVYLLFGSVYWLSSRGYCNHVYLCIRLPGWQNLSYLCVFFRMINFAKSSSKSAFGTCLLR